MKKFAGLKKLVDGINQLQTNTQTDGPTEQESEINDRLTGERFTLAKVIFILIQFDNFYIKFFYFQNRLT